MRRTLILALLALVLGACGEDEPAAQLYGEWLTNHGTTVSYDEDGNWSAQHPDYGSEPFDWGTYSFDGELLTYSTDQGLSCQEGQTGIYEAAFTDDGKLTLKRVEDPCTGRSTDFWGGMVRKTT